MPKLSKVKKQELITKEYFRRRLQIARARQEALKKSLYKNSPLNPIESPNLPDKTAKQIHIQNLAESDDAFKKDLKREFSKFNLDMEGRGKSFYVPSKKSGWTIGQGIDLSGTTRKEALKLGLPAEFIKLADKYKVWGETQESWSSKHKGQKFLPAEASNLVAKTTDPNWEIFINNTVNKYIPLMAKLQKDNPNLSTKGLAALAQLNHWAGSIDSTNDTYFRTSPSKRKELSMAFPKLIRWDKKAKKAYNPIKQALETGNLNDNKLAEIMWNLRDTLPKGYTKNRTTFKRYVNYLLSPEYDTTPIKPEEYNYKLEDARETFAATQTPDPLPSMAAGIGIVSAEDNVNYNDTIPDLEETGLDIF